MRAPVSLGTIFIVANLIVSTASALACPGGNCSTKASKSIGGTSDSKKLGRRGESKETSDASFKTDVLEAKQTVLVDFYAPWCGACKKMSPLVEKLSRSNQGKITVFKVNVDKNPQLASQYGVQAIPAIKLFKEGKVVDESTGLTSLADLQGKIDEAM